MNPLITLIWRKWNTAQLFAYFITVIFQMHHAIWNHSAKKWYHIWGTSGTTQDQPTEIADGYLPKSLSSPNKKAIELPNIVTIISPATWMFLHELVQTNSDAKWRICIIHAFVREIQQSPNRFPSQRDINLQSVSMSWQYDMGYTVSPQCKPIVSICHS